MTDSLAEYNFLHNTQGAKFILAELTLHMVAPAILLDARAAHGAERNIIFVLFDPLLEIGGHGLFTRRVISMPLVSALEADLCLTSRAGQFRGILVRGSKVLPTVRLGTPTHKRV